MNNLIKQNPAKPGTAPFSPIPSQDAVTTRPPAAKGDDDLMSQPVKPS